MQRAAAAAALVGALVAVYGWVDWQSAQRTAAMARRMGADASAGTPWWLLAGLVLVAAGTVVVAVSRRGDG